MKRLLIYVVPLLILSCGKKGSNEKVQKEVVIDTIDTSYCKPVGDPEEYCSDDMTQLEMEDSIWILYQKERDEVETDYERLISKLPEYKKMLGKEKEKWEAYHEAVSELAKQGFHGMSSWGFYVCDMLRQSVKLRKLSFQNLSLHLIKRKGNFCSTIFTSEMIDEAYTAYIDAPEILELLGLEEESEITEYKSVLEKERNSWNEWMKYRTTLSAILPKPLRRVYDGCTNITMREKLRQIKNQNRGIGILSNDLIHCCLPEECSDRVLLEYPCFNKVWSRYCAYPNK